MQLSRGLVAGAVATAVDITVLVFGSAILGTHYLVSAAAGFGTGLSVNYVLNVRWVFERRRCHKPSIEFAAFAGIGILGLLLNHVVMWVITDKLGAHYLTSKLSATALVYAFNFTSRKYLLFN